MRGLATILSALLFIQFTCWGLPAEAATIQFAPAGAAGEGTFVGEVTADKIGKLKLNHGTIAVKGNLVDVLVAGVDPTQKKTVLSGVVYKNRVVGSGSHAKLEGGCFFTSGTAINEIDDPNCEEMIDIADGGVVAGHVVAINHEEVTVEQKNGERRRIAMATVVKIHSPRAFTFSIAIAAVAGAAIATGTAFSATGDQMSFCPTITAKAAAPHVAKAPSEGKAAKVQTSSQGVSAGKICVITAVLLGIATAIAVPVAVGVASGGHHHNNNAANQLAEINFLNSLRRRPEPPPPPPPPPPSSDNNLSIDDDVPSLTL